MKKLLLAVFAVSTIVFSLQNFVSADGMMLPPSEEQLKQIRERILINEPEQKAIVFFNKGEEQLIISPSYEGDASNFAWVIPVPSRPKVEILKGAIFHELAKLTMPIRRTQPKVLSKSAPPAGSAQVTVLERKTVGAYDVSVLSATDGNALMKWLSVNKYYLPEVAVKPVNGYIKDGWTFVACRVKVPETSKALHTGTLAPIRLRFKVKQPVYPMRLSAANPKPFRIQVYLILPTSEIGGKKAAIQLASGPGIHEKAGPIVHVVNRVPHVSPGQNPRTSEWRAVLWKNQKQYPTLAKLNKNEMQVYSLGRRITPQQCSSDYMWMLP